MSNVPKPVFLDNSGKRWRLVVRLGVAIALVVSSLGALLSASIIILPVSPLAIHIQQLVPKLETHDQAERRFLAVMEKEKLKNKIADESRTKPIIHPRSSGKPYSTVVGFYVNWDPNSYDSFRKHVDSLTYVMPEWLTLNPKWIKPSPNGIHHGDPFLTRWNSGTDDPKMEALAKKHKVPIVVMLDNVENGVFSWAPLKKLLSADPAMQWAIVENLRDYILKKHWSGVNLDLEANNADLSGAELEQAQTLIHDGFPRFVKILASVFRPAGLLVTQDLPAANTSFDYAKLSDLNDFVIVMMYDQHILGGAPGPIASQQWIEQVAQKVFANIDSSKVVIGLGNYCYDWTINWQSDGSISSKGGQKLMLGKALTYARDAGAKVQMSDYDRNPYFMYVDENNRDHLVYILDAITAYNHIMALKGYEPRGAALWCLGSEDADIWSFFGSGRLGKPVPSSSLEHVLCKTEGSQTQVNYDSSDQMPELQEVTAKYRAGLRKLTKDRDGLIDSETYKVYPRPYTIHEFGVKGKKVALTFDDGPDPTWTPQVLKVLKKYKVPATFFVIGENADRWQEIVKQELDDGNEVGNHTYTHPHLAEVSPLRAQLEVNATQRIIESITGHATRFLRPPFGQGADSNEQTPEELDMELQMQSLGYIIAGMNIDSEDYKRPGVATIVHTVMNELPKGHVILFHDAGGDRSQTVAALPIVIQKVRERGYKFVSLSDLCGGTSEKELFPPLTESQDRIAGFTSLVFEGDYWLANVLRLVFLLAILLGVMRIFVVAPLALSQWWKSRKQVEDDSFAPTVTVVVPAYNERKVVCKTIEAVLASDYPNVRVIVVDDGSTDDTEQAVQQRFAGEPRLTFLRKENGGKASALNLAIENTEDEILVCVDADTVLAPDAIRKLARNFADPKVGAVAGNVKVGNRLNPLSIWQSVEYITSQNFDRRAYAALAAVPVVPGAIGAWRRSAVLEAGGYSSSTLAEDTDLTFRVRLRGYKTITDNEALAFTEAPDDIRALAKQRFRWGYGILQALWLHRRAMFNLRNGAIGLVVMPSMWLYNIFFQALAPIVDISIIAALFAGGLSVVLPYWAAFFVLDFAASLVAFRLDNENPKALVWLFWQRLFYRQFMYYVIWKSLIVALKGHAVGWGKLHRKATAEILK